MSLTNSVDFTKLAMGNVNSGNTTNIINILGGRGGRGPMPQMTGMGMPPLLNFAGGPHGCRDSFELCGHGHGPRRDHCCEAEYGNSKQGKYEGIASIINAVGGILNPAKGLLGGLFGS